jgi:D-lactate dehydrogenase
MKIFFYEVFDEERACLESMMPDHWQAGYTSQTIQDACATRPPFPHISIRTQSVVPEAWLTHLSTIVSRSTGYDHLLLLKRLTRNRETSLACLPKYCGQAVAEHALMLWMALARKLKTQLRVMNQFHRDGLTGFEMKDKRLVIVGVGDIGFRIAELGKALGMEVVGVDPVERHDKIPYVSLSEGLARADILICAMNLTEANRGIFSIDRWKEAKPGLLFVNISRGECSPFTDLHLALKRGYLSGIALDVFDQESEFAGMLRSGPHPETESLKAAQLLLDHPQVIFTPHNAFNTREATERKCALTIAQFKAYESYGNFIDQPRDLAT